MKLEKVYDELYGMIEDLKKQIAAISGGDDVAITPALESGVKVADYAIGDTEGSLYAPSPVGYSTSEQDTGMTWIDGAPIYKKTIDFGALPNVDTKTVAHGISDLAHIVSCEATATAASGITITLPYTDGAAVDASVASAVKSQVILTFNTTSVMAYCGVDKSAFYAYVTLYYTKTPPTESKNRRKK